MPIPLLLHGQHGDRRPVPYELLGPWIVPSHFGDVSREYEALRHGVGLIDYSTQAVLELQGADRAEFLHRLLTNSIRGLAPGQGCRAALLTPTAKLLAELVVLAEADSHWLICDLTRAEVVRETLDRYLFTDDVQLRPHERQFAALALQGPRALQMIPHLFPDALPCALPYSHQRARSGPVEVRLIRWQVTGDPGLLCLVPAEAVEPMWWWIQAHGAPHGLIPVGWSALNTCRIEAGVPWMEIDMDETNLLPETGLERIAASDTKGCYLGQEIIARMATYGSANKQLVGLTCEGAVVPERGDQVVRGDEAAGAVTSACFSPTLQRAIALTMMKRGAYDEGLSVAVMRGSRALPATIAARPLLPGLAVE